MTTITLPDMMAVAGFIALISGIAAFDWRVALFAAGLLLLIGGIVGMVRGK